MTKKKTNPTHEDYEKLGRAVEGTLVTDYVDWLGNTRRQLISAFMRGIFTGLGTVIGATLMVAVLVWFLHMLGGLPVIGEYLKATGNQIENSTPSK
ncbi:MAG TPA: DUF5665 domain-containing protein [Candidatus Polarisedimenticolaceae bacterium]|nr:DUF5665 domain-containing protein [Candidatus Polarisedimenticolaceae bacterium]